MKKRIIRYRGRERKENVLVVDNKFAGATGSGIAGQLRKRRRR